MSSKLNVKIKKDKVLEALRKTLSAKLSAKENYAKDHAKWEREHKAWQRAVAKKVGKNATPDEVEIRNYHYQEGKVKVEMTYFVKLDGLKEPEQPERQNDWQIKEQVQEIENAIRMLEMCDDDVINTSTYKAISQYL